MANYFYELNSDAPLQNRYQFNRYLSEGEPDYLGVAAWVECITWLFTDYQDYDYAIKKNELFTELRGADAPQNTGYEDGRDLKELILVVLLARLRRIPPARLTPRCPRLFISHRQKDLSIAFDVAKEAFKNHFQVWIDVWDPQIASLASLNLSPKAHALLLACIVEMALLNCTHVVACMTPDTRGSMWVPYEYGRITEVPAAYEIACAYFTAGYDKKDTPEYLYLGKTADSLPDIDRWLRNEKTVWPAKNCMPKYLETLWHLIVKLPIEELRTNRTITLELLTRHGVELGWEL